jgi:apolipoprotein N-acyltransferase
MKPLLLALLAGAAGACGFEPLGLWPLTPIALAILIVLVARAPSLRSALARGWWFGLGQFVIGLNWIATAFTYQAAMPAWLGWVAVVLLSLYLAIFPAAAAGIGWRWGRGSTTRLVLWLASAWIVTEWLRATLFTGFPWNPVGVALLSTSVSRLATLTGTYGLSGITVLLAGCLVLLAERRWKPAAAIALPILAAAALLIRMPMTPAGDRRPIVRIVQPDIGQEEKWRPEQLAGNLAALETLSEGAPHPPRLLLWPEVAVPWPLEDQLAGPGYQQGVVALRHQLGSMLAPGDLLLTGGVTRRSADGLAVTGATNSIFAIDAEGRILGRYDKAHLVPYGEYLPMRPIMSRLGLSRLAPGDVDFAPGPGPRTLDLPVAGKVGLQLCYEMIFSGEVVDRANRPDFIFNPSNDAWFGRWGPPQHLAQARLRALEEAMPVVRATPTGISAIVDSDGRVRASLPWHRRGAIDFFVPAPGRPTLFSRFGNFLPLLLALLLAAGAIALPRKRG